jgi:hypothetical protein
MLSSGMRCYHLELMLSSGTKFYHLEWDVIIQDDMLSWSKCYHLGQNVIIWDDMLLSRANFIIWDEILSSGAVSLMLFSAVKWIGACSEDAVYEGWEAVPGTITPGSVLNVHWVQAVCDPREYSGSRQGQQRALSTMVSCRCLGMTASLQLCRIAT